jgi:ABC-type uncharacterized transport system involved in gliding motility auxiliary subunit
MTTEERPEVAFLSGFGAKSDFDLGDLRTVLSERYTVRTISMAPDSTPAITPESTRVVVLAGPTQSLDTLALARIRNFVDSGGGALVLVDPVDLNPQTAEPIPVYSGLDPLLEEWGLRFNQSLVADLASSERVSLGPRGFFNVVAPYPLWPIVGPAGDHITTRSLSALTLTWAGSLEPVDSAAFVPLWQTTEAAALRSPSLPILPDQEWNIPEDQLAVRTVAAAVDPGGVEGMESGGVQRGRLVVIADASFLDPQFAGANPQNMLFMANAVDWLAQDESLIRIRSKNRTPPALTFTSDWTRNAVKWGNLAGVPLLLVLLGVFRVTGRRRRAEARWKGVTT